MDRGDHHVRARWPRAWPRRVMNACAIARHLAGVGSGWASWGDSGVNPQHRLPGCAPVARPRGGRHPRHVDGHIGRVNTVAATSDVRSTACEHSPTCNQRPSLTSVGMRVPADGRNRNAVRGRRPLPALARSLRADKASSVAFESRFAWLTRILLPPEPQEAPYIQPPPPLQVPRSPNLAKWMKLSARSAI